MNSGNFKYFALVVELSASMLVLGYIGQWLDESYQMFGGYGMLIGIILALIAWFFHATYLMGEDK